METSSDEFTLHTLKRDDGLDLSFDGLIVGAASSENGTQRWTELTLYQTRAGMYVCAEEGHSTAKGEKTLYAGEILQSVEDVIDYFGSGWLAKQLYENASINAAIHVA